MKYHQIMKTVKDEAQWSRNLPVVMTDTRPALDIY